VTRRRAAKTPPPSPAAAAHGFQSVPVCDLPREVFAEYEPVLAAVDAATAAVTARYPDEVACKAGCSECCRSFFEVSLVEGFFLARGVRALPPTAQQRAFQRAAQALRDIEKKRATEDVHARPAVLVKDLDLDFARSLPGVFCPLLDDAGGCGIYPFRPVVCRYFGFPRPQPGSPGAGATLDYCYLNFRGLRARGAEPDPALALDVAGYRTATDAADEALCGRLFDAPRLRYSAPIAEYVVAALRPVKKWADVLTPYRHPVTVAVRRFFEVHGARDETRRNLTNPHAARLAAAWAKTELVAEGAVRDLDLVVDACLDRLSGAAYDAGATRRILIERGPEFRRLALYAALKAAHDAASKAAR